jgi:flagellar hook-basal body complex protein FliE
MKDRSFSEMLQARIDQINRRQERNRKAVMEAVARIETAKAVEASSQSHWPAIRLSALCAK